jgi:hypothetical protein
MRTSTFFLPILLFIICTATVQAKIIHVSADASTIPTMKDGNSHKLSSVQGEIELTVCYEVVPGGDISFDVTLINPEPTQETFQVTLLVVPPVGEPRTLYDNIHTLPGSTQVTKSFTIPIPSGLIRYGIFSFELYIDGEYADGFRCENNSRDNVEIRWDDGVMGGFETWNDPYNIWAIRGCFPEGAILDLVGTRILSEDDPYWPWPDAIHQDIELHIYDDDGPEGLPGTLIWTSGGVTVDPRTGEAIAYPGIHISGTFYIGNLQLTSFPTCEAQAVDDSCNYPDEMFHLKDGYWSNAGSLYGGDFLIWGVGHMGD